ncbi:MAG: HNH endonuclease [candidate division WOR-3 bacterium]|nr:MAG: HNH endonuclease [candidate division WOR-3 bacterium]
MPSGVCTPPAEGNTRTRRSARKKKYSSRGSDSKQGWEVHHVNASRPDVLSNCEILCQSCHKATGTYGR